MRQKTILFKSRRSTEIKARFHFFAKLLQTRKDMEDGKGVKIATEDLWKKPAQLYLSSHI